jgi:hypothetical protein
MYEADKMFLITERDLRSSVALNVSLKKINIGQISDITYKFMSSQDRNYLNVIQIKNNKKT